MNQGKISQLQYKPNKERKKERKMKNLTHLHREDVGHSRAHLGQHSLLDLREVHVAAGEQDTGRCKTDFRLLMR